MLEEADRKNERRKKNEEMSQERLAGRVEGEEVCKMTKRMTKEEMNRR